MNMSVQISRWLKAAVLGAFVAGTLAACGGGGNGGTPVLGGGDGGTTTPTPTAASLSVQLSSPTVANSGNDTVTVTATALDANRAVVGNVPITFAVDNGGVIAPAGTKTDATTGKLNATVQIGSDRTSRTINVTVKSGTLTEKIALSVVDSVSGSKVADLSMVADRTTLPNDGTQTLTVTLTSLDVAKNAIGGTEVAFSVIDPVENGAFVTVPSKTTDAATGQIKAVVSLGSNHTNRNIVLTATAGSVVRNLSFSVITPTVSVPKANDLAVTLDKISLTNAGSEKMTVTVLAVDASRNVVPGIPVAFKVNDSAIITVLNSTTNAEGKAVATVQTGSDRSNRLITVTVSSETLERSVSFNVIGAKLSGSAVPAQPVASSTGNKIEYRLVDVNDIGMPNLPITINGPGQLVVNGTTDLRGAYEYLYAAPATPGPVDIVATAGGVSSTVTVTVPSGTSTIPAATPAVVSASVATSPSVVSINTSATDNRTELRAIFLAANNLPVKNVRVRFDLDGDPNSIGGTISSGTEVVYSNANGIATSNYKPGNRASPTGGVVIRACWGYTDAELANNACPNYVKTTLTVVSDPLSITIGTNETIEEGAGGLTYVKRYVLMVVDAAGNPKSDVQISPSVDLIGYRKGFYVYANNRWSAWHYLDGVLTSGLSAICLAEDVNKNGAIDNGEDRNNSGVLEPRKSDTAISMVGTTQTDGSGTGILKLEYAKSLGSFVEYVISASAFGVLSPPAYYSGSLPIDAAALTRETPPPAFVVGPYGIRRKSSDVGYCTNAD